MSAPEVHGLERSEISKSDYGQPICQSNAQVNAIHDPLTSVRDMIFISVDLPWRAFPKMHRRLHILGCAEVPTSWRLWRVRSSIAATDRIRSCTAVRMFSHTYGEA